MGNYFAGSGLLISSLERWVDRDAEDPEGPTKDEVDGRWQSTDNRRKRDWRLGHE